MSLNKDNLSLIDEYLATLSYVRKLSGHTITSYHHHLTHFASFIGEKELSLVDITRMDARRYVSTLMAKRFEKSTINSYLASLKSFYHYVLKKEKVHINPFTSIQGNPRVRKLPSYLTLSEVHRLLSIEPHDLISMRDMTLFHIFYSTGARMSEVLSMNYSDVDLHEMRIEVVGKGNKRRYVFLTPLAYSFLSRLKEQREGWTHTYPLKDTGASDAIFLSVGGKRLSPSTLHSIFDMYRVKLGLNGRFTPHMMRHSFATHLMNNESPIQLVSELLGHASLSTTQIYTHITTKRLIEVYNNSHPHGRKKDGNTRNDNHSGETGQ